ncbi:MAG: hypothetical protein ACOY93_08310 [Bacillota bacterium]
MAGQSPIPGLKVAGPDDLKELLKLQVAMDFRWIAYFNQRVLDALKAGWSRRLTHLKFIPDVANGLLYMLPALRGEYGAIKLDYSAPETGAQLSLYIPLLQFELEREEGRQRIFTVETREINEASYLALNVRESKSVPAKTRQTKQVPEGTPAEQNAAAEQE